MRAELLKIYCGGVKLGREVVCRPKMKEIWKKKKKYLAQDGNLKVKKAVKGSRRVVNVRRRVKVIRAMGEGGTCISNQKKYKSPDPVNTSRQRGGLQKQLGGDCQTLVQVDPK